jgi:hypothetical protein
LPVEPPAWVPSPGARASASVNPQAPPSEAQLLGEALRQMRDEANPRGTLAQLDLYDQFYPRGHLATEAQVVRAELLLRTSRQNEALIILDRLVLGAGSAPRAVTAVRGELRAEDGRCREAITDFDFVLAEGRADDIAARALYARAACRAQLGDAVGARVDATEYLRSFPKAARRADAQQLVSPPAAKR